MTPQKKTPQKNVLEWTVFAASTVLVAAVLSALFTTGMQQNELPPQLSVTFGTAEPVADAWRVPVHVENTSDATAEDALIEVVLRGSGADEEERAELAIPLLPRHSSRTGWVTFARDPSCCTLHARAVGFMEP